MKNISLRYTSIFFILTMLFVAIGFTIRKQYSNLFNVIVICFFYSVYLYYETRRQFKVKSYIKVLVLSTFILHTCIGQYFGFYQKNNWFDKGLHFFGTFSISIFFYTLIQRLVSVYSDSKVVNFIIISSIGITAGVFLEILEFTLDMLFNTGHQHGLIDTNLDLIFNVVGAYSAGIWCIYSKDFFVVS